MTGIGNREPGTVSVNRFAFPGSRFPAFAYA